MTTWVPLLSVTDNTLKHTQVLGTLVSVPSNSVYVALHLLLVEEKNAAANACIMPFTA